MKGPSAGTGIDRIGVIDNEPGLSQGVLEINRGASQIGHAHFVNDQLNAIEIPYRVVIGLSLTLFMSFFLPQFWHRPDLGISPPVGQSLLSIGQMPGLTQDTAPLRGTTCRVFGEKVGLGDARFLQLAT